MSAKQGTDAWHKERKNKVTGSQVGTILGCSPFSNREKVMQDWLTGKKFEGNAATQWGIDNEALARANYEKLMHTTVEDAYFVTHPKHEWLGASPDGYVGELTLVEIKCPYGKRNDPVPEFKSIHDQPHYYAQIQIQLYCTGRTHCHFFQWTPSLCEMEIVEFSQKWIDENLPKLREFYNEFLVRSDLVGDDLDLCNEYHELKQAFDEAKERLDAHKKLMIAKADGKKRIFGDVQCYPSERKGSINYRKALEDNAPDLDLEPYRGKSSTTWTVK